MKKHTFYRAINIFILPMAAYIAINALMLLFVSLTNPLMLLLDFIMACIPLYAFTSNYFFNRGIKNAQPCKPALKDWIKVNAYVSLFFSAFMFLACLVLLAALNNPAQLQQLKDQIAATSPTPVPEGQLVRYLKIIVYVFLPFTILLVIHIIITLRLLRQYRWVFEDSPNDPE
jgi:hypothetical protein